MRCASRSSAEKPGMSSGQHARSALRRCVRKGLVIFFVLRLRNIDDGAVQVLSAFRQTLPEGFQRSEFLLQHGFLDAIVPRRDMKAYLTQALTWMQGSNGDGAAAKQAS